jgi:hypothetical protein
MLQSVAGSIRNQALKTAYQEAVKAFSQKAELYAVNRDGDLYQVKCPVCNTHLVSPVASGFFVCKKRHVFRIYTEDGVRQIDTEADADGVDLQKDGKDSHGHAEYLILDPEERSPVTISYWIEEQNPTEQTVSDQIWKLKKNVPMVDQEYFNYYVEIDTMLGGKPVAKIGSQIITRPIYMPNMRAFLLLTALKDTDWGFNIIQDSDR